MSGPPAVGQQRCRDADPIVAHDQAQLAGLVGDGDVDAPRPRMAEGVDQGLAPDREQFFVDDRVQGPAQAAHRHAELGATFRRQCLAGAGHRGAQVAAGGGAQVAHAVASLDQGGGGAPQGGFHQRARRLLRGGAQRHRGKTQDQPLHRLQQRVVQFARDAFAFVDALFQARLHARRQTTQPQPVEQPQQGSRRQRAGEPESAALAQGRRDLERQRGAGFIPHAVVVGGHHVETVAARPHVGVVGGAARTGGLPLAVDTVEPVAELHALGHAQAERGVVDPEPFGAGRQSHAGRRRVAAGVGVQGADQGRRRQPVALDAGRIDPEHAGAGAQPQSSVGSGDQRRRRQRTGRAAFQAVERVEAFEAHPEGGVEQGLGQVGSLDAEQGAAGVEPQVAPGQGDDAGGARKGFAADAGERAPAPGRQAGHAVFAAGPQLRAAAVQRQD